MTVHFNAFLHISLTKDIVCYVRQTYMYMQLVFLPLNSCISCLYKTIVDYDCCIQ